MKKPKITVHSIVCNEERWIWYSLMSVIDHVDEIMVWDTGSTDNTVKIIKSIDNPKIKFKQYGPVDPDSFTKAHQEMLNQTQTDWLLWLDGDEIWPEESIKETIKEIKTNNYEFLVSSYYNLIGDIYHYQESKGGKYQIGPYSGHITIRAVNVKKIPGLKFSKPHGQIGLFDQKNILIQDRKPFRTKFLKDSPYLHATHLLRSSTRDKDVQVPKRKPKFKYELGIPFSDNFEYPKVFYLPQPVLVPPPWTKRSFFYTLNALWQTPLKLIKRRFYI